MSLQFEYFDRFTPSYSDDRLAFVAEEIARDDLTAASLFDVGCGDGSALAYLGRQRADLQLQGVDPAQSYVERARAKGFAVELGSVLEPSLANEHHGRHDYVLMASVLHHLVHAESFAVCRAMAATAITHCLGMLRRGGKLFIFEPCSTPLTLNWGAFQLKRHVIRMAGNRRLDVGWANFGAPLVAFFTPKEIAAVIDACGGRIAKTAEIDQTTLITGLARRTRLGLVVRHEDVGRPPAATSGAPGRDRTG